MVTISVITFVLTLVGGYLFDRSTADSRVKDEKDAEQSLDQAEQPFTAAAMYDESGIDNWKLALDRPLTAAEQNKLTSLRPSADGDFTEAWRYLRSLGGRILRYPSLLNAGPLEGYGSLGAESTTFKLNLFSKRARLGGLRQGDGQRVVRGVAQGGTLNGVGSVSVRSGPAEGRAGCGSLRG
jgi:hypothetical protein